MFGELIVVGIVLIALAFYKLSTKHAQYFDERNLKYNGIVGWMKNMYYLFSGNFNAFQISQNMYDSHPQEK